MSAVAAWAIGMRKTRRRRPQERLLDSPFEMQEDLEKAMKEPEKHRRRSKDPWRGDHAEMPGRQTTPARRQS